MTELFGTAALCVAVAFSALGHLDEARAAYQLAGSPVYLLGVDLTIAYHVPRNDALARVDPNSERAPETWVDYLNKWARWNHVQSEGGWR